MKNTNLLLAISLTMLLALPAYTLAAYVEFELLTHPDNVGLLARLIPTAASASIL